MKKILWFGLGIILVGLVVAYMTGELKLNKQEDPVQKDVASTSGGTSTSPNENDPIEGRRLVYFRSVKQDGLTVQVKVDPIEMFGGEAARKAAMEDTKCSKEKVIECAPSLNNAFYIRNLSKNTQSLTASLSTKVYLESATDSTQLEQVGLLELKKVFESWPAERLAVTPFWVTVNIGKITKVEQQYIP